LSGEDRLYDGLFEQLGVLRVHSYNDLIDVPMALSAGVGLKRKRLAILTSTGGAGGLIADVCGLTGFDAPPPGAKTAQRLDALFQHAGFAADRNPIDLTLAGLTPEIMKGAVDALIESPDYDAVIPIVGSSGVGRPDLVAVPVIEVFKTAKKPLIVYTSPSAPEIIRRLNAHAYRPLMRPKDVPPPLKQYSEPATEINFALFPTKQSQMGLLIGGEVRLRFGCLL